MFYLGALFDLRFGHFGDFVFFFFWHFTQVITLIGANRSGVLGNFRHFDSPDR